jgi:hypothetical protein
MIREPYCFFQPRWKQACSCPYAATHENRMLFLHGIPTRNAALPPNPSARYCNTGDARTLLLRNALLRNNRARSRQCSSMEPHHELLQKPQLHTPQSINPPTNPNSQIAVARARSRRQQKKTHQKGRGEGRILTERRGGRSLRRKWQISRRSDLRFGVGAVAVSPGGGRVVLCECSVFSPSAALFYFLFFFCKSQQPCPVRRDLPAHYL